jgi:hypothetical protein
VTGAPPMGGSSSGGRSGFAWFATATGAVRGMGYDAAATMLASGCSSSAALLEGKFRISGVAGWVSWP